MHKINNKNIFIFLMTLVLIIFIIFTSYTYIYNKEYQGEKDKNQVIIFIKKINDSVKIIQKERSNSALFLGSKNQKSFKNLEKNRIISDNTMRDLLVFISMNSQFDIFKKTFEDIIENLKYTRIKVDTLSLNYKNIIFEIYHTQIFNAFFDIIKKMKSQKYSENIHRVLKSYIEFFELNENIELENASILFILSSSKKMDNRDLVLWNRILIKSNLPKLKHNLFKDISIKLNSIMENDSFNTLSKIQRTFIMYGSFDGNYKISIKNWNKSFEKKENYILVAEELLFKIIQKKMKESIGEKKELLVNYTIIMTFLLLLLIVMFITYNNMNKDKELIKEAKKDKETFKEANKAKDLFLANMSHEIRTPLNGIVGFTQLLKNTSLDEDQREFINIIENSSDHLLTIVNDILDISKIQADKILLEEIAFNTLEKFELSLETYGAKASLKDIDLCIFIDPFLPKQIKGDPTRISQVLVNLISNAIKFTHNEGSINISITKQAETQSHVSIKFSVTDSGIGMTPEQCLKIFDAFTQADDSTTRKFGGTGLGLSISSKLVEMMKSELKVESDIDKGTTFYFIASFPKVEDKNSIDIFYPNLVVGLIYPSNEAKKVDQNLILYLKRMKIQIKFYTEEELFKIHESTLPDMIFIDHNCNKRRDDLSRYLTLATTTIILTTGEMREAYKEITQKFNQTILKPLNFTKLSKAVHIFYGYASKETPIKSNVLEKLEGIHALVAEDNIINQKLITRTLKTFGVDITIANNGEEAFNLRKENQGDYDIIFMDIQMPIMNGIESTKAILNFERDHGLKHIPIIALTANALQGDKEKYIAEGMDDYTTKPIKLDDIYNIIKKNACVKSKNNIG